MDGIRERFGAASLTRGVLVGREQRAAMPILPD
jgi:hypothetical protein